MLLMTVISFIVGLSISGQTFYTFILENLEKFGALKAIGAKSHELVADDPVPGDFCLPDGLRAGRWAVLPDHLARQAVSAGLRGHHHLSQSGPCPGHGRDHRRHFELCRRTQGSEIEPFDIFRG